MIRVHKICAILGLLAMLYLIISFVFTTGEGSFLQLSFFRLFKLAIMMTAPVVCFFGFSISWNGKMAKGTRSDSFGILLCLGLIGAFFAITTAIDLGAEIFRKRELSLFDRILSSKPDAPSTMQYVDFYFWLAASFFAIATLIGMISINRTSKQYSAEDTGQIQ